MATPNPEYLPKNPLKINFHDRILVLHKPIVMGILNITPDSFYDGGRFNAEKEMLLQTEKMLEHGAAIIDIGAVSTRPGSSEITEEEEWNRLYPALNMLIKNFPDGIFSIDTIRSGIARKSVGEGAHMINDISGGTFDSQMLPLIAEYKVPYVMMHIQGTPQTMQNNPKYSDVVKEVKSFFEHQLAILSESGIYQNIILDPGFGFGKTLEHNYRLLRNFESFLDLGCPLMAGLSRKSMINKILHIKPEEALPGTIALNVIALLNGAHILRVHDVKEAVQAIELIKFYKNA